MATDPAAHAWPERRGHAKLENLISSKEDTWPDSMGVWRS
jgi:hypothetical protein